MTKPTQAQIEADQPITEYQLMMVLHDKCPRCRGELDTGWECNRCKYDSRWLAEILYDIEGKP